MVHPLFQQHYSHLDKLFEARTRLGICLVLRDVAEMPYSELKEILHESDGNLATHMKKLLAADYVAERKVFHNKKPRTLYRLTIRGGKALKAHGDALKPLLADQGF